MAAARKGEDDCVGFRPSGFDSLVAEQEEAAAELAVILDPRGEAPDSGDEQKRAAAERRARGRGDGDLDPEFAGGKRGEGGRRASRAPYAARGGPGDVEGSTATAAAGAVATGGRHGDSDRAFGRYRTMTFF